MNIVRFIFLDNHFGWELKQFDAKNIFPQPLPNLELGVENKVCWPEKALYELKKSLRVWFGIFIQEVMSLENK